MAHSSPKVKYLCCLLVFLTFFQLSAQSSGQYWQQQVSYNIKVQLNDTKHTLQGVISIDYVNNSPDTLNTLFIHVWPNAYKNSSTAFAKQQLANGSVDFEYAGLDQWGYIDSLDFSVNDIQAKWAFDSTHIDIVELQLHRPLLPGAQLTITTPFKVKIPASFSRLGHVDQSYQITQWFPKPAVYDKDGWHPMPYLDQGEFYSEYGDFTVEITVPKDYRVAASGDLQTESELIWLTELASGNMEPADAPHPNKGPYKTLTYYLENAHDFAWFADKNYYVRKDSVQLPSSGRWVNTWAFFTDINYDLWLKGTTYVNKAVHYYSKWLGDYPHHNATAVEGALAAGGGMEYPTITIIGYTGTERQLETVIVHEVGHFWLYGILGSNERQYPWMDEGINSFYENRYFEEEHPDAKLLTNLPRMLRFLDLDWYERNYGSHLAYYLTATQNKDQPINIHSEDYTSINYGTIVYAKAAVAMQHLRSYLGDAVFDSAMHAYYKEWEFKHPGPDDLRATLEGISQKDLGWFFDDLINTTEPVDYAIRKVERNKDYPDFITVANNKSLVTPFSISGMKGGKIVTTKWYEGIAEKDAVPFPEGDYDSYRIDAGHNTTDINRANNTYRFRGLFKKSEPIKFQFLGSLDNPYKNQVFVLPFLGWNNYDKTLIGLALSNNFFPFKKFEFDILPMYGTGTQTFNLLGRVGRNWYPRNGRIRQIKFSATGKRFSYLLFPEVAQWSKVEPRIEIEFKRNPARSSQHFSLAIRSHNIWQEWFFLGDERTTFFNVNEAWFKYKNDRTLHPFWVKATINQGEFFMNAAAEGRFTIHYLKAKGKVNVRLFAAGFIWNNKSSSDISPPIPVLQLSGSTGTPNQNIIQLQKDYTFDQFYLDRNGYDPVLSRQVVTRDGGFRSFTFFGDNNRFMSTATVSAKAPGWVPIGVFAGVGVVTPIKNQWDLVAEMGFAVVIIPDILEINLPVVTTNNIKLNQETGLGLDKFYERITFTLNLKGLDPLKMIRNRVN